MQYPLTDHLLIDGRRIAVGAHGLGEPVILVHGTPSHSYIWRKVVPRLTAAGRRVYLFDLLGFGASERPVEGDTSVAAQESLLAKLMEAWSVTSCPVIGHDIGGAVALRLALHQPERVSQLMLIDCVSYDSWPSETWSKIIAEHGRSGERLPAEDYQQILTRQLQMTVSDPARMSGETLEAYLAPISGPIGQPSFFRHQVYHYDSRYTEELTPLLADLQPPARILWGADDRWQPVHWAERLSRDIGAPLTVIPNGGHFLMEDAPGAVADNILAFLDEGAEAA